MDKNLLNSQWSMAQFLCHPLFHNSVCQLPSCSALWPHLMFSILLHQFHCVSINIIKWTVVSTVTQPVTEKKKKLTNSENVSHDISYINKNVIKLSEYNQWTAHRFKNGTLWVAQCKTHSKSSTGCQSSVHKNDKQLCLSESNASCSVNGRLLHIAAPQCDNYNDNNNNNNTN